MPTIFKKTLVLLPVVLLGLIYVYDHSDLYERTSGWRLLFLAFLYSVLYGWILVETFSREQSSNMDIAIQAAFFLYIFMILALTGYFTLFREVTTGDWMHKMMTRIDRKDHVNLELFKIFRIYPNTHTQIFGNLLMLFPLGIFIPLLYNKLSGFLATVAFCFLIALLFECLQLATRHRSADVDDIFLNTLGAAAGAVVFQLTRYFAGPSGLDESQLHEEVKPLA
jgi:glycopeptide antibiotics resistance protein